MFQIEKTYNGWSWERISRHVLYWIGWLIFYSVVGSSYNDSSFFTWVLIELSSMCVKLPFTYFVIYYLVPNYLIPKKYIPFLSFQLIAAIIGGMMLWATWGFILNPLIFKGPPLDLYSMKIWYKVIDLIYIASLPTVLKMLQKHSWQEKQTRKLVEQKLGAELEVLKNQLHPHFLFNTLNNLYSMVLTKHTKAADVVLRLSNMMSYMLYECERPLINLDKEISNLENYIELEKIRYGKRLDVSFETGGDIAGKSIGPLLLLPFLENAFKHGVEKEEQSAWVRINLWVENDELTYLVENSIPQESEDEFMPKVQSGIGLSNVKKRLELLYPNSHQFEVKKGDTFLAKLNLKLTNEMSNN